MEVPYSCKVSPDEYGGDDDGENLTGEGRFWSGVIILCLRQKGGGASRRGVRSTHAFTASQMNGINELPSRCGGYLHALCRAPKTVGESQTAAATLNECVDGRKNAHPGGTWSVASWNW